MSAGLVDSRRQAGIGAELFGPIEALDLAQFAQNEQCREGEVPSTCRKRKKASTEYGDNTWA